MTKCEFCNKLASYALLGHKAIHCKDHKTEKEIDVRHSHCEFCSRRPTFGLPNQKALHCSDHKKEGEIDKNNKLSCHFPDCKKKPSYGVEKPIHCFEHKDAHETNVKHTKCAMCDKIASYGIQKATHCFEHKKEGAIDQHNKNMLCPIEGCGKRATYGKERYKGVHCKEHAEVGEWDVNNRKCVQCNLFMVARSPWLCSYCNPSSKKTTKEKTVVDFFHEQKMEFVHNKSIGVVCGNYRPDILFDATTHFVVVEVDEHAHATGDDRYGNICERIRENNIYMALGLPTVFIRYNPDPFQVDGKTSRIKMEKRLQLLLERTKYHLEHVPEKHLRVEFLFYDDYQKKNELFELITAKQLVEFHK